MLRQASRSLFVARGRVLLAASTRVPTKGATQASWNPDQSQTAEQRQQATMRKVAQSQATSQSVEPMGENWGQDADKQGLWERAKDAAQAAKDAFSSNAERAQDKAQDTTQRMNYKMESASDTLSDKYQNAKETISEKYENVKEAVGEKLDSFKDAMQSRTPNTQRTQQRQAKLGSNQPLGKEHTKIDMSLAAMNEQISIEDLQGDLSHDDEVISHAASRASRASNIKDPATAFSTEDLTLQARGVMPQRFQREITFRGDDVITQDDSDDFEPTYQAQRSQQSFTENLKDTSKAAGQTSDKAGSSFMKGLKDTAQVMQNKEAGKKNWQVGDKKSQSWSEVKESADKQFEKFMQGDDKQSSVGQRKGPAYGLEDLTGPTAPAPDTNTFNQKDAGMPQEDIKDIDKQQARTGQQDESDMDELEAKDKNLKNKNLKNKDLKDKDLKDQKGQVKSNFGKKKGPAFGVQELSDAGADAARSTTASSQSKAKGSNDISGMSKKEAGEEDGTKDVARNIALGAPSKTY